MGIHNWKFIGDTKFAKIFIDNRNSATKVETLKYTYYHEGIYPYHNPDYTRKYIKNR